MKTKNKTRLLPENDRKGGFYNAQFTSDGDGVFLLISQNDEASQLCFYNLKNKKLDILSHFQWGVRTAAMSPDGSKIALTVHEAGNWKPYIYYTTSKSFRPVTGLPDGLVAGLKWRNNSQSLGFQLATSYAISDIYEWDSKTGKVIPWVQNEIGGLDVAIKLARKEAGYADDELQQIYEFPEPTFDFTQFLGGIFGFNLKSTIEKANLLKFRAEHNGVPMTLVPIDFWQYYVNE